MSQSQQSLCLKSFSQALKLFQGKATTSKGKSDPFVLATARVSKWREMRVNWNSMKTGEEFLLVNCCAISR